MIEVQVAEHHHVDILVLETGLAQRIDQHVLAFLHTVTLAHARIEERPDTGFKQHCLAFQRAGKQRTAGQLDAIELVRCRPFFPQRTRRVAEHRAAIEALRVSTNRPEFHAPIIGAGSLNNR